MKKISGYDPNRALKGGESLADDGGINVLHTPGYTAGSISFYLPKARTLTAGDAILSAGGARVRFALLSLQ